MKVGLKLMALVAIGMSMLLAVPSARAMQGKHQKEALVTCPADMITGEASFDKFFADLVSCRIRKRSWRTLWLVPLRKPATKTRRTEKKVPKGSTSSALFSINLPQSVVQ
jgi:hypothetical protein